MLLDLNSKGLHQSSGEEKRKLLSCVPSSTKREIRYFHYEVMQQRNVKKKRVMHVQSCCFANMNLFRFCHSRFGRRRRCVSFLMSNWPCLRSYMMISVERVWIVVPFERNNFRQRRVRNWDRPHYQKWQLSQHVNYGDFWETGPCYDSFQLAPVWTQWIKAPYGSSRWGHVDLADGCSQRSQKEDVPNDLVYRTQSLLTLGTRVFFPPQRGIPRGWSHTEASSSKAAI